jgi:hypothetical protein
VIRQLGGRGEGWEAGYLRALLWTMQERRNVSLTIDECGLRFLRKQGETGLPYTITELLPDGAAARSGEGERKGGWLETRESGGSECIILHVCFVRVYGDGFRRCQFSREYCRRCVAVDADMELSV